MMPNMRSVVAQCYRGCRSMGPRRNFSSSIESKKDDNSLYTEITGFPKWMAVGVCLSYAWDYITAIPKWKKINEEQKLVEQRHELLPWEAMRLQLRELRERRELRELRERRERCEHRELRKHRDK